MKKPFAGEAKCTQCTGGKKGTETNMSRNYWEPPQTYSPHYYYWPSDSKPCGLCFWDPQVSCIHKAQWTFSSVTEKFQLRIDDTHQLRRLAFSCGLSSKHPSTSGLDQHQTGPGQSGPSRIITTPKVLLDSCATIKFGYVLGCMCIWSCVFLCYFLNCLWLPVPSAGRLLEL